jgi:hypothetical protein
MTTIFSPGSIAIRKTQVMTYITMAPPLTRKELLVVKSLREAQDDIFSKKSGWTRHLYEAVRRIIYERPAETDAFDWG